MTKARIPLIVVCLAVLFFCTPLGGIPVMFYGVYFYPRQIASNLDRGKPIVQAVYRYRSETGLYPERLGDLVPTYIAAVPKDWRYIAASGARPPKLVRHGAFHTYLTYHFALSSDSDPPPAIEPEGWELDQEGSLHFQGRDKQPVPPSAKTKNEITAARIKELRRRVEAGKKDGSGSEAHMRLISELVGLGRLDEAKSACRNCIEVSEEQWCRMALAELDLRRSSTAELDAFIAWTKQSPSFSKYYALALLYRMHGRTSEAIAVLREAVKHPLDDKDMSHTPEYYGYESAHFAYRNGQHDLVLSICDSWQRFLQVQGYGERSHHSLRAASYLATGRQPEAVQEVAHAVHINREGRTCAGNLPALERAARAGDRKFVYDPGKPGSEYRLFLENIQ